jgi:hypothetical protein
MELTDKIRTAQIRLRNKLQKLDLQAAGISEYNQRYLGKDKFRKLENELKLYGRLIYLSISHSFIPIENAVIIDYGGGCGIFSLLAKELGIGTVIYNDIYDVSCMDVKLLSGILKLKLDHVICGDIDDVISYLKKNHITFISSITSYDVLEHIYDVEAHFKKLDSLLDGEFRVVYGSSANIHNQNYVRGVTNIQIETEYKNKERQWGHKERDCLRAFIDIRKEIIADYAPELLSAQVEELSHLTRGLIQSDIEKCVNEYQLTGNISYRPAHPTNTCDPYTGNWCEHLMDTQWIERVLEAAGFDVEILPGYYILSGSLRRKTAQYLINVAIKLFGRRIMSKAPYFVVYAKHNARQS